MLSAGWLRTWLRVGPLVAALVFASCAFGFGDPLHKADIENTTATPLRVFQDGANRALPLEVPANRRVETAFAWPIDATDGRARMILAEDAAGRRVYCERFRYSDLARVAWLIRITAKDLC